MAPGPSSVERSVVKQAAQRRNVPKLGSSVQDRGTARIPLQWRHTRSIDVPVHQTGLQLCLYRTQ